MMSVNEVILGDANDDWFSVEDIRDTRNTMLQPTVTVKFLPICLLQW